MSERLGIFGVCKWLVDLPPWWAFWIMLGLSPVAVKFVLRPLLEGRILRSRDEFMGFHLQMCFAPALALGLEVSRTASGNIKGAGFGDWALLILAIAAAVIRAKWEGRLASWKAALNPITLYQTAFLAFALYLVLEVSVAAFIAGSWGFGMVVLRLVMLACLAAWFLGVRWDIKHGKDLVDDGSEGERHNRYWYARAEDWQPWKHHYRHFCFWWKRYIADWKLVPARLGVLRENFARQLHL